jgi:hypothetical protein
MGYEDSGPSELNIPNPDLQEEGKRNGREDPERSR